MASNVDICNIALNILGQNPIAALTESSTNARKCNAVYESLRDEVLSSHPWKFATKYATLAELSDETVPDWDYLYTAPSLILLPFRVFNESTKQDDSEPFELIRASTGQNCIATDCQDAQLKYVASIVDSTKFSIQFVKSLSTRLAAELSPGLTGDKDMRKSLMQEYFGYVDEAKRIDRLSKKPRNNPTSTYVDSRG